MKTINALTIRNKFGEVLAYLEETHEPVLVTKGKKLLERIRGVRKPVLENIGSVEALRQLRGSLE